MNLQYHLTGTFIECCNCHVVCPCWVDDEPDEDFCAGIFAWTFDPGSTIQGEELGGRSVVSVTMHGDSRRGGQSTSAIYVDQALSPAVADLLVQAFGGRGGGTLAELATVTGTVVDGVRAAVSVTHEAGGWQVRVQSGSSQLVRAEGLPRRFDFDPAPLTLTHTALSAELGIGGDGVVAQDGSLLQLEVAALPGPPVDVVGRSGMTGRFSYTGDGADGPEPGAPTDPAEVDPEDEPR